LVYAVLDFIVHLRWVLNDQVNGAVVLYFATVGRHCVVHCGTWVLLCWRDNYFHHFFLNDFENFNIVTILLVKVFCAH